MRRHLLMFIMVSWSLLALAASALAQQTNTAVAVGGYTPTAEASPSFKLDIAAGHAYCGSNPSVLTSYAGAAPAFTFGMNTANYVYLDATTGNCAVASSTTPFSQGQIPLAIVVTNSTTITSVADLRSWYVPGVVVLNVSSFPGSDAGAKIANCIAALPTTGGTCDARGLTTGDLTWSTNVFAAVTTPFELILGAATYNITASQVLTQATPGNILIRGNTQDSTVLKWTNAGLPGQAILDASAAGFLELRDLGFHGNSLASRAIVLGSAADPQRYFDKLSHIKIIGCTGISLDMSNGATAGRVAISDSLLYDIKITSGGTYGIDLAGQGIWAYGVDIQNQTLGGLRLNGNSNWTGYGGHFAINKYDIVINGSSAGFQFYGVWFEESISGILNTPEPRNMAPLTLGFYGCKLSTNVAAGGAPLIDTANLTGSITMVGNAISSEAGGTITNLKLSSNMTDNLIRGNAGLSFTDSSSGAYSREPFGLQIDVQGSGGVANTLRLFDATAGATIPYKYIRHVGTTGGGITAGTLQILAGTAIAIGAPLLQVTDVGDTTTAGNVVVGGGTLTGGSAGLTVNSGGIGAQNIRLTPSGAGIVDVVSGGNQLMRVARSANAPTYVLLENQDTGTGAQTEVQLRNGALNADAMRLLVFGTGFTTTGGFVQDSGVLDADSNLSGGMSLVARHSSGAIRLYTSSHTALRMTVQSDGKVAVGNSAAAQKLDVQLGSIVSALNPQTCASPSCTLTFNASLGNTQKVTLDGSVTTASLTNATQGQVLHFIVCQSSGNKTFPQSAWDGDGKVKGWMTISPGASSCSAQTFVFDGSRAFALSTGKTNM